MQRLVFYQELERRPLPSGTWIEKTQKEGKGREGKGREGKKERTRKSESQE